MLLHVEPTSLTFKGIKKPVVTLLGVGNKNMGRCFPGLVNLIGFQREHTNSRKTTLKHMIISAKDMINPEWDRCRKGLKIISWKEIRVGPQRRNIFAENICKSIET